MNTEQKNQITQEIMTAINESVTNPESASKNIVANAAIKSVMQYLPDAAIKSVMQYLPEFVEKLISENRLKISIDSASISRVEPTEMSGSLGIACCNSEIGVSYDERDICKIPSEIKIELVRKE